MRPLKKTPSPFILSKQKNPPKTTIQQNQVAKFYLLVRIAGLGLIFGMASIEASFAQDFVADLDDTEDFDIYEYIDEGVEAPKPVPAFSLLSGAAPNKGFWDSKTLSLTSQMGLAVNPNKREAQEGETALYFNPILVGNLTKSLKDKDSNPYNSRAVSLTGLLYAKDHFDNLAGDVEVTAIYGTYTHRLNKCWSMSASPGTELITLNLYQDHFGWDIPLKAEINRIFYKSPNCEGAKHSNASLRYVRTLSEPSTNNRHELRFTYSKSFAVSENTSMTLKPFIKFTSYSNLANDAELENTDLHLALTLSRKITNAVSVSVKGEIGRRNSTDPLRDSEFGDLPLSISLKRKI